MRELPTYNGVMPQSAQQQFVRVEAPKVEAQGHIIDRAIDNALKVGDKLVELHDLGVQNEVEHKLRENALAKQKEFNRRLALQPGEEGSFFLPDGSENEEAMAAFAHEWQEANRQISGGYIRTDNMLRGQERIAAANDEVKGRVFLGVQARALANQKQAFEDNFALASEMGDWAEAERIADAAGDAGQISRARADRLMFESRQNGYMQRLQEAWNGGAESFAALYDDPAFRAGLSAENVARLEEMARRLPVEAPKLKVKRSVGEDGRVKLEAEVPDAPRGMPAGLVKVWSKHAGNFKGLEAQEEARPELLKYMRGLVQHANDPAELEQAKAVCKLYGHSSEFASQVVTQLRKEFDGTAPFAAREAMKAWMGTGDFFRPKNKAHLEGLRAAVNGLAGRERSKEEEKLFEQKKEELAKWESYEKNESEKAQREIMASYDQWFLNRPDASYREQARMFFKYVTDYSADDAIHFDADRKADEATGIFDARMSRKLADRKLAGEELQADIKKTDAEREKQKEEELKEAEKKKEEEKKAEPKTVRMALDAARGVSRNWKGNATEALLYVPKGHEMAGQEVTLLTPDDVEGKARVVEQEGCEVPVMSQKLRMDMGLLSNPYRELTFEGNVGVLARGSGVQRSEALEKKLGGLAPYYDAFVDAAKVNELDPKLLMAIAMHETGRGTSEAFRNKKNAMGVFDAKGPRSFPSVEASIYYMAEQLRKNYIGKGLRSVAQIGAKYAPVGAANDPRRLNKHWVEGVTSYMNELN